MAVLRQALLLVAVSSSCLAGTVATFTSGTSSARGLNQTVGWSFAVNSNFTVDELYWYDPASILTRDIVVGIWDLSTAVVVPGTDVGPVSGVYDTESSFWEVALASPVVLLAGHTYVIGGQIGPTDPVLDQILGLTTSSVITFGEARASESGSLTFPGGGLSVGVAYIGPNLGPVPSPEPASWALLGAGLAAVAAFRRRA